MKISRYNNFILESADSIESICERYNITNYTINEDGSIDVDGDVKIYGKRLTKLPLKFRRVTGWFICYNNKLTSLEGCPKEVGGYFECYGNKLTSLEGSPKSVGRTFDCSYNKLTNLVGGPEVVLGGYYADNNRINSFEGFPDDFEGEIYFTRNPVQKVLKQFPEDLRTKAIHLINDYDAIWNGEVVEERLEMVKEKLGLNNENFVY
jgi:hypothetical protein